MSQPILIPYFVYHSVRLAYTSTPSGEEDFLPLMLKGYESILAYCAPVFIIIEGLATSLVLEVARKAVKKRDHLQLPLFIGSIVLYLVSGLAVTYVYNTNWVDSLSATLVGVSLTLTISITVFLFVGRKGVITDTALMFTYIVYCIAMMSFDWQNARDKPSPTETIQSDGSLPLPLMIFRKLDFEHVVGFIVQYVQSVKFVSAIQKTLALDVFVALVYRMSVFISAAYFVSKFKQARLEAEAGISHKDDEEIGLRFLNIITSITTPTLIAVYTHLLLCHFGYLDGRNFIWRWLNIFCFLFIHTAEILYDDDDAWDFEKEGLGRRFFDDYYEAD
ncbi:678_t:CDS:2 [Paraglomus occultum]|uniref:678_t:CDS:1 n=1 Tax=Paraglomus occultum TaxID=144539 RepID=A0A9N9A6M3_9GLOM|nr:678_t:CDS:2 [Paraglomus occultum]